MRILIAYDGSDCAKSAITGLARAGLPEGCDATVLSVADVWLPAGLEGAAVHEEVLPGFKASRAQADRALKAARELAEEGRGKLQGVFPHWRIAAEACADSPAWSIIKHADQSPYELVVVGSHGRSGLGRLVMGSVSMRVLTESRCSVRIGRAPPAHRSIRIIVGTDGSDGAEAAISAVRARCWPPETQIRIVTVANWRLHYSPVAPPLIMSTPLNLWADTVSQRAHSSFADCQFLVTTVVKNGDAKDILVEEARSWEADCIFVGARGLTGVDRMLLGSVSSAVAMRAPCSVEVVHPRRAK